MERLLKQAQNGNSMAQIELAHCLEHGDGIPGDAAEAARWYRKAAEQGNPNAQFALAEMYARGKGVSVDEEESIRWLRKAALNGHCEAQFSLATALSLGKGVEQDFAEAFRWFRKAAEQGIYQALYIMGSMYEKGEGVAKDRAEAGRLYRKAAICGYAPDSSESALSEDVENKYDAATVRGLRRAAELGDAPAQYYLGVICLDWTESEYANLDEAERWIRKAAEQGIAKAQCVLGVMLFRESGSAADYLQAAEWFRKAAEQNDSYAQCNLGFMYMKGLGVPQDFDEASRWCRKSVGEGHLSENCNLEILYDKDDAISRKYQSLMTLESELDNIALSEALMSLGDMLFTGHGLEQDYAEARRKYHCAAAVALDESRIGSLLLPDNGSGDLEKRRKAVKLYCAAAWHRYGVSGCKRAVIHEYGLGIPRDYHKALGCYRRAVSRNIPLAQYTLGNAYCKGTELVGGKNTTAGRDLLEKFVGQFRRADGEFRASDEGLRSALSDALTTLTALYRYGEGVEADEAKACRLEEEARQLGSPDAAALSRFLRDVGHDSEWLPYFPR